MHFQLFKYSASNECLGIRFVSTALNIAALIISSVVILGVQVVSLERNLFQRIHTVLEQQIGRKYELIKVGVIGAFDSDGRERFKKARGSADSETGVFE
ncbi:MULTISPECIES: hypothetical protein [unclassified Pseudomonas]|jgi:hypothetical protein|uniref:hypothetical protein n=1 Tax=unclassified Pseudomonas TaxID=196821 RepID=UPI0012FF1DBC|nr:MULTISPECIES: hypothetical protein [unclassified Pseudomonas]